MLGGFTYSEELITVTCKCCGSVYKDHPMSNACKYSLIPNFGCDKCKGETKEKQ
jgi:hypothetical protein